MGEWPLVVEKEERREEREGVRKSEGWSRGYLEESGGFGGSVVWCGVLCCVVQSKGYIVPVERKGRRRAEKPAGRLSPPKLIPIPLIIQTHRPLRPLTLSSPRTSFPRTPPTSTPTPHLLPLTTHDLPPGRLRPSQQPLIMQPLLQAQIFRLRSEERTFQILHWGTVSAGRRSGGRFEMLAHVLEVGGQVCKGRVLWGW